MLKDDILSCLYSEPSFISGEALAERFSCSRMNINKAVSALRDEGYKIDGVKNKGYILDKTDMLSEVALKSTFPDYDIIFLTHTDSTNKVLKSLEKKSERITLCLSLAQSGGRGRLGRSFSSPSGGLYFSILIPSSFISDPALITAKAAVAVSTAIEKNTGLDCQIKWVNDVYINGKKCSGILSEGILDMELQCLESVIVGIGINVNSSRSSYPEELWDIITTVYDESVKKTDRLVLLKDIITFLLSSQNDFISEYRKRCFILGKKIKYVRNGKVFSALAKDVDDMAHLIVVSEDGKEEVLSSGEVSLNLKSI